MAHAGRTADVDRQPRRGRDQERHRIVHLAAVGYLPAHPRLLDHVIGVSRTAEHHPAMPSRRGRVCTNNGISLRHLAVDRGCVSVGFMPPT